MKISISWISEFFSCYISKKKIIKILERLGFEVKSLPNDDINFVVFDFISSRIDCFFVEGIVKELNFFFKKKKFNLKNINFYYKEFTFNRDIKFLTVFNKNKKCYDYVGYLFKNINNNISIPILISNKLKIFSIDNLSPVDDLVHYMYIESGQFSHAFDYDRLLYFNCDYAAEFPIYKDSLHVFFNSCSVAISGCFFSNTYSITKGSTNIFLEFSNYDNLSILKNKFYYFNSSYYFFDKMLYFLSFFTKNLIHKYLNFFCTLLSGNLFGIFLMGNKYFTYKKYIIFKLDNFKKVIGKCISIMDVKNFFFNTESFFLHKGNIFYSLFFFYRFDIVNEIDLIGELIRFFFLTNKEFLSKRININYFKSRNNTFFEKQRTFLENFFICNNFFQVITYSFNYSERNLFNFTDKKNCLFIENPILKDMCLLRHSLIPNLLNTLKYNQDHGYSHIKFFEIGSIFVIDKQILYQKEVVSGLCCGLVYTEQWHKSAKVCIDFFDVKNIVMILCQRIFFSTNIKVEVFELRFLDKLQSCHILLNNFVVGFFGLLNSSLEKIYKFNYPVYLFEIFLEGMIYERKKVFSNISKYNLIRRDLSIILDKKIYIGFVLDFLKELSIKFLYDVILFDVYENYSETLKSVSFGFFFLQKDALEVLTDLVLNDCCNKIIFYLQKSFKCELRTK